MIEKSVFLRMMEEQVESHLDQMVSRIQNLSAERLVQPPQTGGWSIVHCLEHLNTYAQFYYPHLSKLPAIHNARQDFYQPGRIGKYFVKSMETPSSVKRYKAVKRHSPQLKGDPYVTVSEFISYLEELLFLIREYQFHDINLRFVPVSILWLVRLSAGETIHFLNVHNQRHLLQIGRLLEEN